MVIEDETGWIPCLSEDGLMPFLLVREDGEWNIASISLLSDEKVIRVLFTLYLLVSIVGSFAFPSTARATPASDSGPSNSQLVSALTIERPTRVYENRKETLSRREETLRDCLIIPRSTLDINWKPYDCIDPDRPEVEAETIARGMRGYVIVPENCLDIWKVSHPPDVELSTARLNFLVKYREQTVVPYLNYLTSLSREIDQKVWECLPSYITKKIKWVENEVVDTIGTCINIKSIDSVSTAMRAVQDAIVNRQRIIDNTTNYRLDWLRQKAQRNYFVKTKNLKRETEEFIAESRRAITKAEEEISQTKKVSSFKFVYKRIKPSPARRRMHRFRLENQSINSLPVQLKLNLLQSNIKSLRVEKQFINSHIQLAKLKLEAQPARLKRQSGKLSLTQLKIDSLICEMKSVKMKIKAVKCEIDLVRCKMEPVKLKNHFIGVQHSPKR